MTTATNPETGERAILADGRWQVFTKTATNPETGEKAYLVGDSWVSPLGTEETPEKPLDPRDYNPLSVKNILGAAIEPGLAMGTGGVGAAVGGLAGMGAMANRAAGYDTGDPESHIRNITEALSYQPRTKGGQVATEAITAPLQKYAEVSEKLGGEAAAYTGSPAYGAVTNAMLQGAPMIMGAKTINAVPAFPKVNRAIRTVPDKIGQGVTSLKEMVTNRLPGSRDKIVTEMLRDTAGERLPKLKLALENADPQLTAGQAGVPAKSYEFSALSKMAEEKLPSEYGAIRDAQQVGRVDNLRMISGELEKQQFMKNIRKGVSDKLYTAGRKGTLPEADVKGIVAKIDKTIAENPGNRTLRMELKKAREGLVDNKGNIRTEAQEVMSTVDGLRVSLDAQGIAPIKGQLSQLKKEIAGLSSKYKQAEKFYAETSRPITQMEVGQELIDTITPRMGSQERASAYANAIQNQKLTMRKAEGKNPVHGEFEAVMAKDQLKIIKQIGKELDNNADFKAQAMAGRKRMNEIVGTMWDMPKARILERTMVIINTILKRIEGRGSAKTIEYFAELGKPENRHRLLELIERATPEEKAILLEASKLKSEAAVGAMIAGAEQQENN